MGMRLFERIRKLRLPKRRTANPLPVLTWEELDRDDEAELLQEVKEDGEQDVLALQRAMRGPN